MRSESRKQSTELALGLVNSQHSNVGDENRGQSAWDIRRCAQHLWAKLTTEGRLGDPTPLPKQLVYVAGTGRVNLGVLGRPPHGRAI